jgi:hypothetical protein
MFSILKKSLILLWVTWANFFNNGLIAVQFCYTLNGDTLVTYVTFRHKMQTSDCFVAKQIISYILRVVCVCVRTL